MQQHVEHPEYASTLQTVATFKDNGFDVQRPLHIISGERVHLLTVDGPGEAQVIGIIEHGTFFGKRTGEGGKLHRWSLVGKAYDGHHSIPRGFDLKSNTQRPFDWGLPYRTRSGYPARLVASDRAGERTHVCLISNLRKNESAFREKVQLYYDNGAVQKNGVPNEWDLVNVAF